MHVGPAARVATLLRDRKKDLIERWAHRVLEDPKVPQANRLERPELLDHVPTLLDHLADALESGTHESGSGEAGGRTIGANQDAEVHAAHRAAERYSIEEALRELSHLRGAIVELCSEEGVTLEGEAAQLVHATLDESMQTCGREMERAALEFRDRFTGILGHDLRNPLASISFSAAALLQRRDTSEAHARYLRRIASSADRMATMISDLLDLTRARLGGGLPINPEAADMHAICQQAIDELEGVRPSSAIALDAQGNGEGAWDRGRVAQVLSNLISNALEYSTPQTPVRVAVRDHGDTVVIDVNNQGPTIEPEVMATIFDPFRQGSQSERASARRGLGLGLFIARQIVEAHGGSLAVSSTPEEGTTFTVRLPRSSPGAGAPPRPSARPPAP
jgi:signal transduction histidine kinase